MIEIKVGDRFYLDGSAGDPIYRCIRVQTVDDIVIVTGFSQSLGELSFFAEFCVKCDGEKL